MSDEFGGKRVPICHLVYGVIILILIAIFVILVAPSRVSDFAFYNFSFAATLISIVLAVVSIVYSLQSGLSNNSYKAKMDEVQKGISSQLSEFQKVEESLKKLVEEHRQNLKSNVKEQSSNEVE